MTIESAGGSSLGALNLDCLRNIRDFCSIKGKAFLSSSSRGLQPLLQKVPEEAKAFLVFESKLPLIKEILRKTQAYREGQLDLQETRFFHWEPIPQNPTALVDRVAVQIFPIWNSFSVFSAWVPVSMVYFLLVMLAEVQDEATRTRLGTLPGDQRLMLAASVMLLMYLAPRLTLSRDLSVPLMGRWYDLQRAIPDDLLVAGELLQPELTAHDRMSSLYSIAGGIDRYYAQHGYTGGGLNYILNEIRHRNLIACLERLS